MNIPFMKRETKHEKKYVGAPSGGGQIVCSCGYETPVVDDSNHFTLGSKVKTVEEYFGEHLVSVKSAETAMVQPAEEHAVAPAQHSQPRGPKRTVEQRQTSKTGEQL